MRPRTSEPSAAPSWGCLRLGAILGMLAREALWAGEMLRINGSSGRAGPLGTPALASRCSCFR